MSYEHTVDEAIQVIIGDVSRVFLTEDDPRLVTFRQRLADLMGYVILCEEAASKAVRSQQNLNRMFSKFKSETSESKKRMAQLIDKSIDDIRKARKPLLEKIRTLEEELRIARIPAPVIAPAQIVRKKKVRRPVTKKATHKRALVSVGSSTPVWML